MNNGTADRWTRPDSVPFPSIWCRFQGRREINGVIPKFWIQDIPVDQFETVINYMVTGFLIDEPTCKHSDLVSEKQSVEDFRDMWKDILKDKLGLICYMENVDPNGEPIIAAMNCTHIIGKSDKFSMKLNGKKSAKIMNTIVHVSQMKDIYEELGIDSYLNAMGLYVLPEFRGQGLGLELLKAREPLCRAVGIKATVTAFTATASQILAARAGFKDLSVISYAELERLYPTMRYPGIEKHTKDIKYMYILY